MKSVCVERYQDSAALVEFENVYDICISVPSEYGVPRFVTDGAAGDLKNLPWGKVAGLLASAFLIGTP